MWASGHCGFNKLYDPSIWRKTRENTVGESNHFVTYGNTSQILLSKNTHARSAQTFQAEFIDENLHLKEIFTLRYLLEK